MYCFTWGFTCVFWEARTLRKKKARGVQKNREDVTLQHPVDVEQEIQQRDLLKALESLLETLSPEDKALLLACKEEKQEAFTPTERKRKERALGRLKTLWRRVYGT
jgi:hypothetical protein